MAGQRVLGIVLAGGAGTRLAPLTYVGCPRGCTSVEKDVERERGFVVSEGGITVVGKGQKVL